MLSISDEQKESIVRLMNAIVSDSPVVTNLNNRSIVSQKLVKLIHYFEHSISEGNKSLLVLKCVSFEALIENWLLDYYCEDSVMESFDIEEGVEQELSTASLLILYVIHKFSICFPHIVMYFNDHWNQLRVFNARLDQMLKKDKVAALLRQQMDANTSSNATVNTSTSTTAGDDDYNDSTNYGQTAASDSRTADTGSDIEYHIKSEAVEFLDAINDMDAESMGGLPTAYATAGLQLKPNTVHTYSSLASMADELIIPQMLDTGGNGSSPDQTSQSGGQTSSGQTLVCLYCHRSFASKYKLKRHEFVHKPLSKPFMCPWNGCELRFRSSFDMRRHLVTHTGERNFGCDECGKHFSRADKLKEHKQTHTKRMARSVARQSAAAATASVATDVVAAGESLLAVDTRAVAGVESNEFNVFDADLFDHQLVVKTELNVL
ncbi:unnamed protein product [Medioppia subpectinata]|uniref:C2H2-type domain-containing protein n=1 Tax=Medioppia subpectinata TaxID=1979941 RepID=A0A7R9KU58_9ACAR|nr:unnamed protein product [Medioppia subpectinata]CAG2109943.1 unnamed protein product [Medioppia subpectinata]